MTEHTENATVSRVFDFTNLQQCTYAYLDKLLDDAPPKSYKTGIEPLDSNLGGLRRSEVCVLGGRTSQGKSLVALQWLYEVALSGSPCLLISEEMGREQLAQRLLSYTTGNSRNELGRYHYDEYFDAITEFWKDRAKCHVVNGVATVGRAVEAIEHAVKYYGVEFVVVDYLQLLKGQGHTRYEQISMVSQALKSATVTNNVAMVALAQVGRAMESRDNIPQLRDLKESGQIEQDADQVIIVQWPLKSDPRTPDPFEYRLFCLKNRNGPLNEPVLKLRINPVWQRIEEAIAHSKQNQEHAFDQFNDRGLG